jgi:hypothetical protein
MSLLGHQKQKWLRLIGMSALPPEADIASATRQVGQTQKPEVTLLFRSPCQQSQSPTAI